MNSEAVNVEWRGLFIKERQSTSQKRVKLKRFTGGVGIFGLWSVRNRTSERIIYQKYPGRNSSRLRSVHQKKNETLPCYMRQNSRFHYIIAQQRWLLTSTFFTAVFSPLPVFQSWHDLAFWHVTCFITAVAGVHSVVFKYVTWYCHVYVTTDGLWIRNWINYKRITGN
jgi:hypothetical protein